VGLTEEHARHQGVEVASGTAELSGVARSSTYLRNYDPCPAC